MKLKVEGRTTEAGFRILTTPCPGPMTCKVGSTACANCEFFKGRQGDVVYCRFGDKVRKGGAAHEAEGIRPACDCGNPEASWHGIGFGRREWCCDSCWLMSPAAKP